MHKNMVNKHLIDALITSKLNVSDKLYVLDDYSLAYLEQIKNIYNCDDYKNNNEKYKAMLVVAGEDDVTKICRDIRQCIVNMSRYPYITEYDNSEENLSTDMLYVQMVITHNRRMREGEQ